MELFFLAVLFLTMAFALGSGYPVAFSLPGAAIISIVAAAVFGYLFEGLLMHIFTAVVPTNGFLQVLPI